MKILLTGGLGFLGRKIYESLSDDTANMISILDYGEGSDLRYNIVNDEINLPEKFDFVIHAAGKAHSIPKTLLENKEFYDINFQGTINLLKALEINPPNSFLFISTVAVYGLINGNDILESEPLLAKDPYGESKIFAEKTVVEWCNERNIPYIILRLPLVVGGNPPGNLKAMINAIKKGYYFHINNGTARKSMVLASDIAEFIPSLYMKKGIYNLTDGIHPTFNELSNIIAMNFKKNIILNIPLFWANIFGKVGDLIGERAPLNTLRVHKITRDLTFNDIKARNNLNWRPKSVLENFNV